MADADEPEAASTTRYDDPGERSRTTRLPNRSAACVAVASDGWPSGPVMRSDDDGVALRTEIWPTPPATRNSGPGTPGPCAAGG